MIRVLNITEEGRGGGPLKRIRNVARLLKEKDIQTVVLFPNNNSDDFKNALERDGVDYLQVPLHRLTKEKKTLFKYVLSFWKEVFHIRKIIKENNIDIVHANGAWQVKGILAAKLSKIPSVWHMNDSFQHNAVKKLFHLFSSKATGYIYASNKTKKYYQNINTHIANKKDVLLQAPVDTKKFIPGPKTNKLSGDGFKLITVGYVNPNKGFETLIHAMHELSKLGSIVQMFIVGTIFESQAGYHDILKQLIQKYHLANVHFLGYRSDVKDLLHSADLYICSSDFEASPIAVWEALSCGLPVVSTDVGDVREIFENNTCGGVVDTQDPQALANEIHSLLQDPKQMQLYGENGRKTALDLFSLEHVTAEHEKFYKSLVT